MIALFIDAQLPPALARRIVALGHAAEHVADGGLATAPDETIRRYAAQTGAVIVTKDEDLTVHRVLHEGPPVVWVRIGNNAQSGTVAAHRGRLRCDRHRARTR